MMNVLNVLNAIVSALSVVSEIHVDVYKDNTVEVYTENYDSYNEVQEILENMNAVEDDEKSFELNEEVARDEEIYYTVYNLNNVEITVQLNLM